MIVVVFDGLQLIVLEMDFSPINVSEENVAETKAFTSNAVTADDRSSHIGMIGYFAQSYKNSKQFSG